MKEIYIQKKIIISESILTDFKKLKFDYFHDGDDVYIAFYTMTRSLSDWLHANGLIEIHVDFSGANQLMLNDDGIHVYEQIGLKIQENKTDLSS